MTKDRLESQLPLALASLAAAFCEVLLEAQPALQAPLKMAVLKWAHLTDDAGPGDYELAAATLKALSRALHDSSLFPKKSP